MYPIAHRALFALLLFAPAAACSEDVEYAAPGVIEIENKDDNDALAQCGGPPACPDAFAQRIEGGSPFTLNDMPCLLTALRDRTPGMYHIEFDHTWTNGSSSTDLSVFITPAGQVETGSYSSSYTSFGGNGNGSDSSESYGATQRCDLMPASFFDDCLAHFTADGYAEEAWECIDPEAGEHAPWFDNCVQQVPTCM